MAADVCSYRPYRSRPNLRMCGICNNALWSVNTLSVSLASELLIVVLSSIRGRVFLGDLDWENILLLFLFIF